MAALGLVAVAVPAAVAAVVFWPLSYRPPYGERFDPRTAGSISIADPSVALTFARTVDVPHRVILVTRYHNGMVDGVDVSDALGRTVTDPIEALTDQGYEGLAALAAGRPRRASVSADRLGIPVDLGSRHIAVGLNFAEHAGEVAVTEGPFLFPKLVTPTAWNDPVQAGHALLDHEVEVAWVPISPIRQGSAPTEVGMILVDDYTDRATLLELVDTDDEASGIGFTTAKSAPGYLPVGDLFVVPRDPAAFARDIELDLYANDDLRQRGRLSETVWDLDAIVEQTFQRRSLSWDHRGQRVSLLGDADEIPARSLILAGTPAGTVYTGIDLPRRIEGFLRWLAFGWDRSIPDNAIDAYIDDARTAGLYLQPGDRVTMRADNLGVIQNTVSE